MNPAFYVARDTANNLASGFREAKDENAIERILSEAMNTGDANVVQNSIGKILSQVSPERQKVAVQYLENVFQNIQAKNESNRKQALDQKAAEEGGYTYGAPPQVQAAQAKENAKNKRLQNFGLGSPIGNISPNIPSPNENIENGSPITSSPFKSLTDDQLTILTGSPDREVSEPAKAELQNRINERKLDEKRKDSWTKFDQDVAKKVIERADEIAEALPQKESALNSMIDAIANKNFGFFSWDNLAEKTGIEALRSPEGALFKTASKEYFLGNIARAGARPNQWIEQQIQDMLTKIGRSTEANLSVTRALQNELAIEKERIRLTREIFQNMRETGQSVSQLGAEVNKQLSKFAEDKQQELYNDLRAIKAIGENKPQKFHKVAKGTRVSPYMVDALLNAFNNDDVKALNEAKKLGYDVE